MPWRATIECIEAASGKQPVGWLGAGLVETWNTLDYLAEAGIRFVCDWVNDDQPYQFEQEALPAGCRRTAEQQEAAGASIAGIRQIAEGNHEQPRRDPGLGQE